MLVEVYKNSHKNCFSVRDCLSRKILGYSNRLVLRNCKFVVQQGGRNRVLKEKKKNVHAFVRGNFDTEEHNITNSGGDLFFIYNNTRPFLYNEIRYNPYKNKCFERLDKKIDKLDFVYFEGVQVYG